ncbi:hypothetical protein AVEN_15184-1 [Araneus ventricosus]|uniref:Uncharacterized protein n=1 Tax=Araneus ventricosus TaxID=182803 RepID=A0A4Y2MR11_ARAVE|nr:hypothetical protein AVEN_15184-1 [Araneus ventricosus]
MASRNGPNAVEGQLKRKPNQVHSRTNRDHHSPCTAESERTCFAALSKIRRWMWLCDDFVTDFLKPKARCTLADSSRFGR